MVVGMVLFKVIQIKKIGYDFNKDARVDTSVRRVSIKEVFQENYDLIIMRE